jgi:hypothetical protein
LGCRVLRGGKKNKGLDLKRIAASALVAALEDANVQPQAPKHRSGARRVLAGAALVAAGRVAWTAAHTHLPDLSDLKARALDRLDDLGLLDEDDVDDTVDDVEDLVDEDEEDFDDEDEDDYVPDRESVVED